MVRSKKGASTRQTERLASALFEQQRYSTLGSLVKGIIHNLNGSLQVLSMHMELLEKMLNGKGEQIEPPLQNKMSQCLRQIDKLKAIIEELALKARHDEQDAPQAIDLNAILEECFSLFYHDLFFKHQVKLVKNLSAPLPALQGRYIDFHQGLSNLLQNAIEAMEGTSRKELTVETLSIPHGVQVVIKDTGVGIREEMRPLLFTPFFTTKSGRHNGLGLYISKELLSPYGASFTPAFRDGETTFMLTFPIQACLLGS